MILLIIAIIFGAVLVEGWAFMLLVGMAHIHLAEAIHPVSYSVSLQFVLVLSLFQFFGAFAKNLNTDSK